MAEGGSAWQTVTEGQRTVGASDAPAGCAAKCAPLAASWRGTPRRGRGSAQAPPAARSATPPTVSRTLVTLNFLLYVCLDCTKQRLLLVYKERMIIADMQTQ